MGAMNTKALLLLASLSLAGCDGEDWLEDDIAGAYDAEIGGQYARALVTPGDAIAWLPDSGTIYGGNLSSWDSYVDGYFTRYRTRRYNSFSSHALAERGGDFEGELYSGDEIDGDYREGSILRAMNFQLDYDASFNDGSVSRLAGSYAIDQGSDWLDLDISSSGVIEGEDSGGCLFDGSLSSASINVLPARITVDCPGQPVYDANAIVSEFSFGGRRWITIAAYGRDQAWAAELPRS